MSNHNLRYFALGAVTALTALGWVLDKITPEVGTGVILGLIGLITADVVKHRNNTES